MVMFESETDMLDTIQRHDSLVRDCVEGRLTFAEFCDSYDDFYTLYALDGHESDEEERRLLEKHDARIELHRIIAYGILGMVCSDSDAQLDSYKQAGRFGSAEALERLADLLSSDFREPRGGHEHTV
jgi:hypothetical protein